MHAQRPLTAAAGTVSPYGIVVGDCGYSYINLMEKSNGQPVRMTTGFHVNDAAISYNWNASVGGPNYQHTYLSSGNLAFRNDWNGSHNSDLNYPHGVYYASVSSNYSYALLFWGGLCVSGGPTQATPL
jgi:hypothetical protein